MQVISDRRGVVRCSQSAAKLVVHVFFAGLSGTAVADPSAAPNRGQDLCPVAPGAHLHDGFFARSDAGLALLSASVSNSVQTHGRSAIHAIGQSASISVGATPLRGLVIGINVWTAVLDPTFVQNGKTIVPDDNSVKLTLLRAGPMFDWYPNPQGGFHLLGTAGFAAQIEHDTKGNPIYPVPKGLSASTGVGYEWFTSSELSLGLLARFAFGWLTRSPASMPERMLFVSPELALTATYH